MGDSELFTPITQGRADSIPWRERSRLSEGCGKFEDVDETYDVFITAEAAATIVDATKAADPNEAFGFLVGRVYQDDQGTYTVVTGAVTDGRATATRSGIQLSPEEVGYLQREAETHFPALDLVGWWHSHGVESEYSSVDRQEQHTWPHPFNVGILAFATGAIWATAYRGPESHKLQLARAPATPTVQLQQHDADEGPFFAGRALTQDPSSGSTEKNRKDESAADPGDHADVTAAGSSPRFDTGYAALPRQPDQSLRNAARSDNHLFQGNVAAKESPRKGSIADRRRRIAVLSGAGVLILTGVAAIVLLLLTNDDELVATEATATPGTTARDREWRPPASSSTPEPSSRIGGPGPTGAPTTTEPPLGVTSWDCLPDGPLSVVCSISPADVPGVNSWRWEFGDQKSSMSRAPRHTYDAAGTYTVRLTAITSRGERPVGDRPLEVKE